MAACSLLLCVSHPVHTLPPARAAAARAVSSRRRCGRCALFHVLRLYSLVKNIPPQPNPIRVLLPPPMLHTRRIACLRLAALTTAAAAPAAPRHVQAVAGVHVRWFAPRFASQTQRFSRTCKNETGSWFSSSFIHSRPSRTSDAPIHCHSSQMHSCADARPKSQTAACEEDHTCLRGCALTRGVAATGSPRAVGRQHGIIGVRCARQPCELRFTDENTPGVQQKREGARGDIQGDGGPRES